jgi:HTH-type transcriptional regulator / antitoxin HipB
MYLLTGIPRCDIFPIGNMNTKNPEQLGAAIRTRRKQLKVTQKDLAMTCGTGLRFIIDLEKGKPTCQIGKMLQVLQALGLKLQIVSPGVDTGQGETS